MKPDILFLILLFFVRIAGFSQDDPEKKFSLNGYISNMQSVMTDDLKGNWISDNLFHNRLNASWYPSKNLLFTMQLRNRLMYGETVKYSPVYAEAIDKDNGYMDLSLNIINERSFFLNTAIDRINFQLTKGKFVATIGRQRINWGISSVWNPNDIFNVQNYFDFDYIEKPGSDAVRLQYYTGVSSSAEIAAKLDGKNHLTLAGYYRFTTGGYDFQFLAGTLEEEDYLAGFGWSGDIKNISFKGEMSYFLPMKNTKDTSGVYFIAAGGDYMFSNSLFTQLEVLYCKLPEGFNLSNFITWYQGNLNVKNLSFTNLSLFGSLSYPVTPIFNANIAGMYFPDIKGFFAGPSVDYSLTDDMQLSIITQVFSGELPDLFTQKKKRNNLYLGFIRYKISF